MKTFITLPILATILFFSCKPTSEVDKEVQCRTYCTSFEKVSDFDGFYITPQNYKGTSFHKLSDTIVKHGAFAHYAWIKGKNEASTPTINNNHRAYPTIQFQKTNDGVFPTPCFIKFYVWADANLKKQTGEDDWISFATFSSDESDNWSRTVLVNLSHDSILHLMHVPNQGEQTHIFQKKDLKFPMKQWVEIKVQLDFSENGFAKVWQNGTLVSHAKVNSPKNQIAQAHFGLYCPPHMTSAIVINDDLQFSTCDF